MCQAPNFDFFEVSTQGSLPLPRQPWARPIAHLVVGLAGFRQDSATAEICECDGGR